MTTTSYKHAQHAQSDASAFAVGVRAEMPHCVSDAERADIAEIVGLAEEAAKLLSRSLSLYDSYLEKPTRG